MTSSSSTSKHNPGLPRTLAIAGGKGGVGKTSVALSLALTLSRLGHRVLLLDGDTDLANVSILVGLYPKKTLADVISGDCRIEDVLLHADYGLHIVPGASGVQACMDLGPEDSARVLGALARLERRYDYILIDTAAGLQATTLHMIAAAELACVVVTPDPASLTDAFSLIKVLRRRGYRRRPSILVNMAQGASQARSVFQRLDAAARRHLGDSLHYLGAIWRDETLRQSVLTQRPVALLPASDPSCRQFHTLVDMLEVRLSQLPPRKAGIAAYWYSAARRQARSPVSAPVVPAESARQTCQRAIDQLDTVLARDDADVMLRYEAFNRLFALLGRTLDGDAIEIVQTGLAALPWERVPADLRQRMARHLRDLADQLAAPETAADPVGEDHETGAEPVYDRVSFGDQERLLQVLREQPADIALDELLRSLAGKARKPRS
jgi:MinD-like ATPase involved in chromosome partitioning or flagellar assembly